MCDNHQMTSTQSQTDPAYDGLVKSRNFSILLFPRKRESSKFKEFWTPASAGVTVLDLLRFHQLQKFEISNEIGQGIWQLVIGICLGFEIWDLEF